MDDNGTTVNVVTDETTATLDNANDGNEEFNNNNVEIPVQQDTRESSTDDVSSCSPINPSDEAFLEDSTHSSIELTEEDHLHGIQPEVNTPQLDDIPIEQQVDITLDENKFEEHRVDLDVPVVNGHSEIVELDLKLSETAQPSTKFHQVEKRENPFDKVTENDDSDLWQYQNKSLEEIERFSESFSPQNSLPSSPEKQVQSPNHMPGTSDDNIWLQQTSVSSDHHPHFDLIPHERKHQKPLNDFSSSVEDVEQAIREIKVKHSPVNVPIDDPWIKIEPTPSTSTTITKQSMPTTAIPSDPPRVKQRPVENVSKIQPATEAPSPVTPQQSFVRPVYDVGGPCEPEDLIEGIIFTANYLGSTQLQSERNPGKNARMLQAQEAVSRIKAPEGESQPSVEVDLFISTDKVKILNAETQETMMDHTLRSISYIADIGKLLVIMARRKVAKPNNSDENELLREPKQPKSHRIICHVFSSQDAHLMAQAIGQAFNVAYQQFLTTNGIEPQTLTRDDYNELLDMQEMYHDDLVHYSKQENVKDVWVEKKKGESMGIVVVESGWGSIVPTVILANLQHGSPVERCGKLSIGDQIMTVNGTSLVGLPITTCQSIIKGLRSQSLAHLHIVSCPPVVTVLIKRPDLKYQLGFSVQDGIICSLMRGGIAERGGVRVGHRIIEINGQSVVATPHDKIVQQLVSSLGEIQMKTMPATMYRLLTGQEQPIYI